MGACIWRRDGTHMKANASKHKSLHDDRAGDLEQILRQGIEELLARAENSGQRHGRLPPSIPHLTP